jgi:hypothetical protein
VISAHYMHRHLHCEIPDPEIPSERNFVSGIAAMTHDDRSHRHSATTRTRATPISRSPLATTRRSLTANTAPRPSLLAQPIAAAPATGHPSRARIHHVPIGNSTSRSPLTNRANASRYSPNHFAHLAGDPAREELHNGITAHYMCRYFQSEMKASRTLDL